jgi:coenzyme F420-dependent glucose-6-phosphate dehydrogenase
VSGFGIDAAALAGRIGDGYWGHGEDPEPAEAYERAGGTGPRYAQIHCCWSADASSARELVADIWPNAAIPGQLAQDLPTWTHFQQAAALVGPETVGEKVPCGPDIVEDLVDRVRRAADAGFDHLYFHQIGPDQAGFLRFWERELRPALTAVAVGV